MNEAPAIGSPAMSGDMFLRLLIFLLDVVVDKGVVINQARSSLNLEGTVRDREESSNHKSKERPDQLAGQLGSNLLQPWSQQSKVGGGA